LGLATGMAARWCDRTITRRLTRQRMNHKERIRTSWDRRGTSDTRFALTSAGHFISGQPARRRLIGRHRDGPKSRPAITVQEFDLVTVVLAATLEELVYRGFLVSACWLLPVVTLQIAALVGLVLMFALSHVWFGWVHVLAKLPLGALTMLSV